VSVPTQHEIDKALVSMAIKNALLDYGKDAHDKVVKRLNDNNFSIPDCFDHPDYFNKIIDEQFGSSYTKIIHSILVWLGESSSNELISDFLVSVIKQKTMHIDDDRDLTKSAILLAIEKALLEMGTPELKRVEAKLISDFDCTLESCVSNPTPLKKVLCELFGYCYNDIYQSMAYTLNGTSMNKNTTKFLLIMKE